MNTFLTLQLIGISAFVLIGYLLSRLLKRNDIADTLWGLGFITVALLHSTQIPTLTFRAKLVLVLVLLWGLRLSIHLGIRSFSHSREDIRYANWRRDWGTQEPLYAFLKVFLLQGIVLGIVSLPLPILLHSPSSEITPYDFLGLCLFVIGFLFEAIADTELMLFKHDPKNKGRVMDRGLWNLSRHPNYFGEILIWWGFFFLAVSVSGGIWTIVSPLLITYLLLQVSGVPMLEKVMQSKGEAFSHYVKNTPSLLPFGLQDVKSFVLIILSLSLLDFVWLGLIMNRFYIQETLTVARIVDGSWDVLYWPAIGVYVFMALGLKTLVITPSQSRTQALFRGAILGLTIYAVYDFTNLSLVKDWPLQMSLIDIAWGSILCGVTSAITYGTHQS